MDEQAIEPGAPERMAQIYTPELGKANDARCFHKAQERGQTTFTLVAQDGSAPRVICEWIKENIESCPPEKLREALERAIEMRDFPQRKNAD